MSKKPYTLYTAGTPNGIKASIALEELGLYYEVRSLDFSTAEQKEDWFLQINPNGRIPALVDHEEGDFAIFESGAILHWLAQKHGKLLSKDPKEASVTMQWLMFQMGGLGPMQGQANHFVSFAPEQIPYAQKRYLDETRRLYEVLNTRLEQVDYLAGDYSIADIANWSWVAVHGFSKTDISGLDALQRWLKRIGERPAVQRGNQVPKEVVKREWWDI